MQPARYRRLNAGHNCSELGSIFNPLAASGPGTTNKAPIEFSVIPRCVTVYIISRFPYFGVGAAFHSRYSLCLLSCISFIIHKGASRRAVRLNEASFVENLQSAATWRTEINLKDPFGRL